MNKIPAGRWLTSVIFTTLTAILVTSCGNSPTPVSTETPATEGTDCCIPADTSTQSSPFYFEISSNEVMAGPGEIAVLPLTVSHAIPAMEAINIILAPVSGQRWRFALCYEDLCFASDGQKTITRALTLKAGNNLQIEIKYFVPDTAASAETMTLELRAESGDSPLVNTSILTTATIK